VGASSYESITKLGTGFSDEALQTLTGVLKPQKTKSCPSNYEVPDGPDQPDVWFEPGEVWEVEAADMSLSPVHKSGAGDVDGSERGVALRFPRFIRRREDKGATDATSSQQMIAMYRAQVGTAPPRPLPPSFGPSTCCRHL